MHSEEKVKDDFTISKPCHVSNIKGKGEDSKWTLDHEKEESISEHTMNRSKAHIPGLDAGATQIPRDAAVDKSGNIKDEIDRFTHGLEDTPQPSRPNCCPIFLDSRLGKIRLRV